MSVIDGEQRPAGSTARRVRGVLAIRPLRRLILSGYLCSVGDWLGFLALSGLASQLLHGYFAQNFAFSGVVLTNLLPGLVFAPIGGVLADRFDRRTVMVVTDLARCALFVSIPFVGTVWWLFTANFLVGCMAMLWIPAKDSSVPNLVRHRDQVEAANQVGLVVTYGAAVLTGATLYAVVSGFGSSLHVADSAYGIASVIVLCNGLLYAASAAVIWTRIPEISTVAERGGRRVGARVRDGAGFFDMLRGGLRIAGATPLIRGLLVGMVGAFAAAGAVIGTARQYAQSLRGGESVLGVLFMTLFLGLATGMLLAPRLAHRMTHNRLFGVAIVVAGLALAVAGLAPHLVLAVVAVYVVGAAAGVAFLTGITIIGSQVADTVRGRVNSVYQALMKVVLFASTILVPVLVGLTRPHTVAVFGRSMTVDGTRPVLCGAGLLAAAFGVVAYRQMGDRSTESILANLVRMVRGRSGHWDAGGRGGPLVTVEGDDAERVDEQVHRIAGWLRAGGRDVVVAGAGDGRSDDGRVGDALAAAGLRGARARALVAAAVRADLVERTIRPALRAGSAVVTARYSEPRAAPPGVDQQELDGLAGWATERLEPDVTVLLDTADPEPAGRARGDEGWRVRTVLAELAAAEPQRYIVVDADGAPGEVTERIAARLGAVLSVPTSAAARTDTTVS